MGVALSAASSFKNSLFLSPLFSLNFCCSVFSFLGRPNIPHNTHSASQQKSPHHKKKKEEEEETEEEVKEEEETEEEVKEEEETEEK